MVAKATIDVIIITLLSWLMLIAVSFVIALLLQELPRSASATLSDIRVLIGIALIGLWLLTWFKLVSFYFWKRMRKNYKK